MRSEPSGLIRSTEIWLLPASTTSRNRPSRVSCSDPWEAVACPVPAPPTANGEPEIAVSVPSAWRSYPATVFTPAVLSLMYTCPTTRDDAEAAPARDHRHRRDEHDCERRNEISSSLDLLEYRRERIASQTRLRLSGRALRNACTPMNVFLNGSHAFGRLNETRAPP